MKKNIVGGKVLGKAANIDMKVNEAYKTNTEFWNTISSEFLGVTALPMWGGYLPSEEKLNLLGDLSDKSVLEIGWATNLDKTFKHIHSYLKKDGIFVFGWSHPIHKCVSVEDGILVFSNSYFNEGWYCADMSDKKIMLSNRMISTYINSLASNGFAVEKLIEETDKEKARASDNDFGRKALMLPTAFVIKVRKL